MRSVFDDGIGAVSEVKHSLLTLAAVVGEARCGTADSEGRTVAVKESDC